MKIFTRIISKLLTVSFLEILAVKVCFSSGRQSGDYNYCNNRGNEKQYFIGSNSEMTWTLANGLCQSKNSSLTVIQNKDQQNAFERYLECLKSNGSRIHSVWTSGVRKTYSNWKWINGQTLSNAQTIATDSHPSKTHVALNEPFSLAAENPLNNAWYFCQQKDHPCNGQNQVSLTKGCLIPSENDKSWYDARNECLSKGGDLAVLTDQDLKILQNRAFLHSTNWIGLRRVNWVWKLHTGNQEEVKYTKWARQTHPTSGEICISINTADGLWTASECNNTMPVVCEKHDKIPTSKTTNSVSSKSTVTKPTTTPKDPAATSTITTITGIISTTKYNYVSSTLHPDKETNETTNKPMEESGTPFALIGIILGVTVPVFLVIVILTIIVVNQKRKLRKISVSGSENTDEAQYQALQRSQIYENDVDNYTTLTLQPKQSNVSFYQENH